MNALLRSHCELTVALLAKCILNLSRFEKTLKQHLFLTHGKIDFLQTVFKTLTLKSLYLSNQKILKKMRAVSLFDTFGVI
jgi:hypothetical protein